MLLSNNLADIVFISVITCIAVYSAMHMRRKNKKLQIMLLFVTWILAVLILLDEEYLWVKIPSVVAVIGLPTLPGGCIFLYYWLKKSKEFNVFVMLAISVNIATITGLLFAISNYG